FGCNAVVAEPTRSVLRHWNSGCLDEDIHALPDINRQGAMIEAVNHLQDARVGAFGAGAGQRSLGHDIALDPLALQRRLQLRIASDIGLRGGRWLDPPGVGFININADVQSAIIAKQHERRRDCTALGKLPKMGVDLQNAAINKSPDRMPLYLNFDLSDLCLCYRERRFRYADVEATVRQLHRTDGSARCQTLSNFEQVFALSEACFRLPDLGIGYIELRGQITGIKLEKRLAGADAVSPFDINGIDDSRHRRADGNIPGAGFNEAGARNITRKGRCS